MAATNLKDKSLQKIGKYEKKKEEWLQKVHSHSLILYYSVPYFYF